MTYPTRYRPQELLFERGGVKTFSGRDPLNGLPVRIYQFQGEPTARPNDLTSEHIPTILSATFQEGRGQVVTIFSRAHKPLQGPVAADEVPSLLVETARALHDAAKAGVVHGDLRPERILHADGHYLVEGYGVPWEVDPSEYSPPERIGGASYAGDVFSWAMTVRSLAGPHLSGALRDLLSTCLSAEPQARPKARELLGRLEAYPWDAPPADVPPYDSSPFDTFDVGTDEDLPLEGAFEALESPQARRPVRIVPSGSGKKEDPSDEESLPAEALRRTDATPAYAERRALYEAQRHEEASQTPARAERAKVRVAKVKAAEADGPEDDFEVIDDIDDRAPDPTVSQGGRRAALLSMLAVATLVLLALLYFNSGLGI